MPLSLRVICIFTCILGKDNVHLSGDPIMCNSSPWVTQMVGGSWNPSKEALSKTPAHALLRMTVDMCVLGSGSREGVEEGFQVSVTGKGWLPQISLPNCHSVPN